MQGEYRGDFTRDTFYQANHFCRVLMQQGRVQLDADWNEQAAILLHYLRGLGRDLIGQHGGPKSAGFLITTNNTAGDLTISPGHYYVDGILCESEGSSGFTGNLATAPSYLTQPDLPNPPAFSVPGTALAYLDVWERHLASAQQDSIREVALGGPDTASRSKVVWQVKLVLPSPQLPPALQNLLNKLDGLPAGSNQTFNIPDTQWQQIVPYFQPANRGFLRARIQPQAMSTDACSISPQSAYRGTENQLYRVEVHYGSRDVDPNGTALGPTYKWSRENGSVAFPILKLGSSANSDGSTQITVSVASLGRDSHLSLEFNDWVEVVDDASDLNGTPSSLLQVTDIDFTNLVVTLAIPSGANFDPTKFDLTRHPLLRRWDGQGQITESNSTWLTLEDGIQVQFLPGFTANLVTQYRSGDYWLIPARVATGAIEWPIQLDPQGKPVLDTNNNPVPAALQPHGVEHHYAPLGFVSVRSNANGGVTLVDLRRTFTPLAGG